MPDIRATLLAEIDAYLERTGMAESTFGKNAINDGRFVGDLRSGERRRELKTGTIERVRTYIRDNPKPPPGRKRRKESND